MLVILLRFISLFIFGMALSALFKGEDVEIFLILGCFLSIKADVLELKE